MQRLILLAPNFSIGREFIRSSIGAQYEPRITVVTGENELRNTRGLDPDDTPWMIYPGANWNADQRETYKTLEQRFGPAWSIGSCMDRLMRDRPAARAHGTY